MPQFDASIPKKMAKQTTYKIDGRNFIVTPIFHEDKRDNGSPEWYPYIVNIAVLTA